MQKKIVKKFLVFQIMVFEPLAGIYLSYDENSFDRQATREHVDSRRVFWNRNFCAFG